MSNTITTTSRRGTQPGRLTTTAEAKLHDAVAVLLNASTSDYEGTAMVSEAIELANGLRAFIEAYRGAK